MEALKAKLRRLPKVPTKTLVMAAAIAVAAAVLIGLCITASNYRYIQRRYTSARNQLGEAVYQNLFMMIHRGEELTLTGTDVQGAVLPAMEEYFAVGSALNESLREAFGARYAVLSVDQTAALRSAFEAYEAAFKGGLATDAAQADLLAALAQVEQTLNERYDEKGKLKPAS